jgi:hypothetical protein
VNVFKWKVLKSFEKKKKDPHEKKRVKLAFEKPNKCFGVCSSTVRSNGCTCVGARGSGL